MKKIYLAIASLVALSFASCANDDAFENAQDVTSENTLCITASFGDAGSRLAIDENLEMQTWSEGDILVATDEEGKVSEFKMEEGAGTNTATFSGKAQTTDCKLTFTVKNANTPEEPAMQTGLDSKTHLNGSLAVVSDPIEVTKGQKELKDLTFKNALSIMDVTVQLPKVYFDGVGELEVDKVTLDFGSDNKYDISYQLTFYNANPETPIKAYIPAPVAEEFAPENGEVSCIVTFKPLHEGDAPAGFEVKTKGITKTYTNGNTYAFDFTQVECETWALASDVDIMKSYLDNTLRKIKLDADFTVVDQISLLDGVELDLNKKNLTVGEKGILNFEDDATVKVFNGKVLAGADAAVFALALAEGVKFNLNDVVIETEDEETVCESFVYCTGSNNVINIENCTFTGKSTKGLIAQDPGNLQGKNLNNKWTIKGGTITANSGYAMSFMSYPVFTVTKFGDIDEIKYDSYNEVVLDGCKVYGSDCVQVSNSNLTLKNEATLTSLSTAPDMSEPGEKLLSTGFPLNIQTMSSGRNLTYRYLNTGKIELGSDCVLSYESSDVSRKPGIGAACYQSDKYKPTLAEGTYVICGYYYRDKKMPYNEHYEYNHIALVTSDGWIIQD